MTASSTTSLPVDYLTVRVQPIVEAAAAARQAAGGGAARRRPPPAAALSAAACRCRIAAAAAPLAAPQWRSGLLVSGDWGRPNCCQSAWRAPERRGPSCPSPAPPTLWWSK